MTNEMRRAYRTASLANYRASGVLSGYRRLASKSARTCLACLLADGEFYTLDVAFEEHPAGRCTMVPVLASGEAPEWETGRDWFGRQSEATQRRVMGPAAFEAWRAGAVGLDELVERHEHPVWGGALVVRSLRKALGEGEAKRFLRQALLRSPGERSGESWPSVAEQISALTDPKAVLPMGHLPAQSYAVMRKTWPASVTDRVVLTGERRAHYLERHAEMAALEGELLATLFEPDEVHRNRYDPRMAIFYHRFDPEHYLRVALWVSDDSTKQNSVFSFRKARVSEIERERKAKRVLWKK